MVLPEITLTAPFPQFGREHIVRCGVIEVEVAGTGPEQNISRIYKARRNRCSDGRRTNVHTFRSNPRLGDKDRSSATNNVYRAAIRNRQRACAGPGRKKASVQARPTDAEPTIEVRG